MSAFCTQSDAGVQLGLKFQFWACARVVSTKGEQGLGTEWLWFREEDCGWLKARNQVSSFGFLSLKSKISISSFYHVNNLFHMPCNTVVHHTPNFCCQWQAWQSEKCSPIPDVWFMERRISWPILLCIKGKKMPKYVLYIYMLEKSLVFLKLFLSQLVLIWDFAIKQTFLKAACRYVLT